MAYQDNQSPFWSAAAQRDAVSSTRDQGLRSYMLGIYNYMASALVLTGIMAYAGAYVPAVHNLLYAVNANGHMTLSGFGWLVFIAPLFFSLGIGAGINRLSIPAAQGLFWAFAAVMGLSLSSMFFVYTGASLTRVFFITAIMFCSMSIFGYSSKKDLTSMGHFMIMGFWGIFVASIVNMFLGSSAIYFAISVMGVVIFTGLTAYDTQRLKSLYYSVGNSSDATARVKIIGALQLYIDFINLFIMLVRLMGDRR